ncbi:hypothetical protein ACLOJK_036635 [Asimina triloba]
MNKDSLFPLSSSSSSSASFIPCGLDQKPIASTYKVAAAAAAKRPEPLSLSPTFSSNHSSSRSKYYKYERVFRYFDKDEDGRISPFELCACLATLEEEISMEEAEAVVEWADSDGDGLLSFEEFVGLVEVDDIEEKKKDLREAFGMYEETSTDRRGCITPKSLKRMLSRLGESKTMEECSAMISRFDLNGDGVLSFDEFLVMMN